MSQGILAPSQKPEVVCLEDSQDPSSLMTDDEPTVPAQFPGGTSRASSSSALGGISGILSASGSVSRPAGDLNCLGGGDQPEDIVNGPGDLANLLMAAGCDDAFSQEPGDGSLGYLDPGFPDTLGLDGSPPHEGTQCWK